MKTETLVGIIENVVELYCSRGFTIISIAADNGFALIINNGNFASIGVDINLTSED